MNGTKPPVPAAALLLCFCLIAAGHRLDEYLQASRIFLFEDHLEIQIYLTPGVNLAKAVFSVIDLDHNGLISPEEEIAYSKRLLDNLILRVDNRVQALGINGWSFPSRADMEEGVGVIRLRLTAPVQTGSAKHHLYFENNNDPGISVYLMNVMMPDDENIRIVGQDRDFIQRRYTVDYETRSKELAALQTQPAIYLALGLGLFLTFVGILRPYYRRNSNGPCGDHGDSRLDVQSRNER